MKNTLSRRILDIFLVLCVSFSASTLVCRADEGLWPPNKLPVRQLKEVMGFTVTPQWVKRWQRSSLGISANAGSGAFISPEGLVLTNWHVALPYLQRISTGTANYARDGFYAATKRDEIPLPGLTLYSESWEDVTSGMRAALTAAGTADVNATMDKLAEASKDGYYDDANIMEVVPGAEYLLHRAKSFRDIRLVMAPEYNAAFFGAEADNFEFPRYCLDMALLRVYENGSPLKSPDYFRFSKTGAGEGDLVFIAGWPAVTERRKSLEELKFKRDYFLPDAIERGSRVIKIYEDYYSAAGPEKSKDVTDKLFTLGNDLKRYEGQLKELKDPATLALKAAQEEELRRGIAGAPELAKKYGNLFEDIQELTRQQSTAYPRNHYGKDWGSRLVKNVFSLVKELECEGGLSPAVMKKIFLKPVFDSGLEERLFRSDLEAALAAPGQGDEYVTLLAAGDPARTARELIGGSRYADAEFRKELLTGGREALQQSGDPLIQWALRIYALHKDDQKHEEAQAERLQKLAALYVKAAAEVLGDSFYPDADNDLILRLSYGKVAGYRDGGVEIPYRTVLSGMYKHAVDHGNKPPYVLPASFDRKPGEIASDTPFNFVSNADMVGGNSGSPVFDRSGELVGVVFDGNAQASKWTYAYSAEKGRSIILDVRAITEALRHIYGMGYLAEEITKWKGSDF